MIDQQQTIDLLHGLVAVPSLSREEAMAIREKEQDAAAAVHHLLVVRAGTSVTIVDAHSGTTPPPLDAVASAWTPTPPPRSSPRPASTRRIGPRSRAS